MDCHQICCTTGPCKRLTNYPKKFTGLATTSGKQVHCANIKNCHCPLCQHEQEIPWHFLECQHPLRTQLFLQFQCSLSSLHSTAKIDPHMFQLLWQGLSSIQQQYSIDDHISTISTYVSSSMEHRMGPIFLWPNCYILDHPHWPQHPDKNKWNYILLTNDIPSLGVHPGIIARAQQCPTLPDPRATFNIRYWNPKYCRSSSKLLMTLFYMAMNPPLMVEQVMQQPICIICRFVQTSNTQICNNLQAAHWWAQMKIWDIRSYFTTPVWHCLATTSPATQCCLILYFLCFWCEFFNIPTLWQVR